MAQRRTPRPEYSTYRSPHGPRYSVPFNLYGIDLKAATRFGGVAASFGTVAGIFALFFFSDVPKVKKDIMQKIPVIGDYFIKEVPPSDNPF